MTSALKTAELQPADIEGRIDAVANGRIYGWAWNRNRPEEHIEIEIRLDGHPVASLRADRPREDLKANGVGDGDHAFEATVDTGPNASLSVVARSPSTGAMVPLRPRNETETAAEALLVQPIRRLQTMMEAIHQTQQQVQAGHNAVMRSLRELPKDDGKEDARTAALHERLDGLASTQESLEKQVAGIEVFLLRIDGTLRDLDEGLKRLSPGSKDNTLRVVVAVMGVAVAVAVGVTLAFQAGVF